MNVKILPIAIDLDVKILVSLAHFIKKELLLRNWIIKMAKYMNYQKILILY